ncbi:FAD-dependent oxidoreductase [Zhihengliuella alba]|uniref:FAD-dependent oxidoreductase n=1 Tax=Zhihengliuella alba TaxID=547018 RepID=A0ABP7DJ41_9MICC
METNGRGIDSIVVVGGGVAGLTVLRELRRHGYAGSLTLVDPDGLPYDRPPLSKGYLLGEKSGEDILLSPPDWFVENRVDLHAGRVREIRPDCGAVLLDDGREIAADRIVLATGGTPRRLPVPGGDLPDVLALRTRDDADRLRAELSPGRRLVVVGAGLIGAEVASAAAALGAETTLIEPVDPPLVPAVGPEIARRLHDMHAEHGVRVITAVPSAIERHAEGFSVHVDPDAASPAAPRAGASSAAEPTSTAPGAPGDLGLTVPADVVLVGIGVRPDTALAEAAGLEVDDGVVVDPSQLTSHPRVYAVGDAARTRAADGTLRRRAEHWEHAMHSGTTAAAALLGLPLPQHGAPWFWSDRYGVHVEGVGSMVGGETTVLRFAAAEAEAEAVGAEGAVGNAGGGAPGTEPSTEAAAGGASAERGPLVAAFRLGADGTMIGAAAIDGGALIRAARRIIDRGIVVDPVQLADPAVDVKRFARGR